MFSRQRDPGTAVAGDGGAGRAPAGRVRVPSHHRDIGASFQAKALENLDGTQTHGIAVDKAELLTEVKIGDAQHGEPPVGNFPGHRK